MKTLNYVPMVVKLRQAVEVENRAKVAAGTVHFVAVTGSDGKRVYLKLGGDDLVELEPGEYEVLLKRLV